MNQWLWFQHKHLYVVRHRFAIEGAQIIFPVIWSQPFLRSFDSYFIVVTFEGKNKVESIPGVTCDGQTFIQGWGWGGVQAGSASDSPGQQTLELEGSRQRKFLQSTQFGLKATIYHKSKIWVTSNKQNIFSSHNWSAEDQFVIFKVQWRRWNYVGERSPNTDMGAVGNENCKGNTCHICLSQ